jgi:predicted ATP-grasp superfamily ATP-dependent carboligase
VFGCGNFQGLAVMRGLGRCGIPVIAVAKAGGPGLKSRYASEVWNVPDTHVDPEGVVGVVVQIGERLKQQGRRGVLIPTQDSTVELLCRHRDRFPDSLVCHLPDHSIIKACSDKQVQCRLARELGVPLPNTYFDDERDQLFAALDSGAQGFPLVFKSKKELPPSLRKKFRIILIEDRAQLERVLAEADAAGITHLIQDVIPGGDDALYTFGSYMNRAGELRAWFTGRKLRQQPPLFGVCRVGESKRVPEIVEDGVKLLRGLHYFGISQVESKYDLRDGRYKLIEVNPRAWAWVALPIGMQVNLAHAFFCDALGIDTPMQEMPDLTGVYISLFDDLYWSLKARDGRPWAHLFKGYDLVVEAYYAPDDPMPGLIQFGRRSGDFAQSAVKNVLRRMRVRA